MNKAIACLDESFCGAVGIYSQGTFYSHGFGDADKANRRPNNAHTKFGTASAGKAFVAVGIIQLIEMGQLTLETTLGDVLDLSYETIDPTVTIRMLLNHTSGVPDYFDESEMSDYEALWVETPSYRMRRSKDLLPLFENKPMLHQKGERFLYNNSGYVLLGLVIEAITKMPFDAYLEKKVFKPADMSDTGYFEMDSLPANCAYAYIFDENRNVFRTNIFSVEAKGTGAGGAFTTVVDVQKFWMALIEGRLVSKDHLKQMFSVQAMDPSEDDYYGYGFWLRKVENGFQPFFEGSDPGVSFISNYDPKKHEIVTLISNQGDNVWALRRKLSACL